MARTQCKDCDNIKLLQNRGNGKCAKCHGDGLDHSFASGLVSSIAGSPKKCYKCKGSGKCQTCRGEGYISS